MERTQAPERLAAAMRRHPFAVDVALAAAVVVVTVLLPGPAYRDAGPALLLGLLISVPLVVWGSTLILKLIERFPVIVYIGAGAIAWTAGRMIAHDHLLSGWFEPRPWCGYALDALLIALICGGGWLAQRRRARAA